MPATLVVHRAQPVDAPLAHVTVRVDGTEHAALKVGETATVVLAPGAHTLQIALDGGAAPEHGFDVGDREDAFVLYASVAMGSAGNEVRLASSTGEPWPPVAAPASGAAEEAPSALPGAAAPETIVATSSVPAPTDVGTPRHAAGAIPTLAESALMGADGRLHPSVEAVPVVGPSAAAAAAMRPHRGAAILGLGLLACFVVPALMGLVFGLLFSGILSAAVGVLAIVMAVQERAGMQRGEIDPSGRRLVTAGLALGVLSLLLRLGTVFVWRIF